MLTSAKIKLHVRSNELESIIFRLFSKAIVFHIFTYLPTDSLLGVKHFLDLAKQVQIKKRGISSLPVPRSEAFAMPCVVERATSKSTPIWIHPPLYGYATTWRHPTNGSSWAIPIKGMWLDTSRGHLPLQCSWQHMKVAKFQNVKNKALSKRLYYYNVMIPITPSVNPIVYLPSVCCCM